MPTRVLMLLHYTPPKRSMAAHRALRLLRHLPELGVEPVIVTGPAGGSAGGRGPILADGVEEIAGRRMRVVRVRGWDSVSRSLPGGAGPADGVGSRRWKRWKRVARSFMVPDEMFGWRRAWTRGGIAAASEGVDAVFSSSTPYSIHLAAMELAARLNKPWILEMRDQWSDNPILPHLNNPLTRGAMKRAEERCLRSARRIVVTSRTHAARLVERGVAAEERIRVVTNMFEPYPAGTRRGGRGAGATLRILHAGNLYGRRTLAGLGAAVDASAEAVLEAAGVTYDHPWEVVLGGSGPRRRIHGLLPPEEIRTLMLEVHAGVVAPYHGGDDVHIPGKLYETIGAGLPVLDLTPQREIPSLCEGTVPCFKADPRDGEALRRALGDLAAWWRDRPDGIELPGADHPLSAQAAARRLAGVIEEAVR